MRHKPSAFDASTFSSRARTCETCNDQGGSEPSDLEDKEHKRKTKRKKKKKVKVKKKKVKKVDVVSKKKGNGGDEEVTASGLQQLALAITDAFRGAKEMYETKADVVGKGKGGAGGEFVGPENHSSPKRDVAGGSDTGMGTAGDGYGRGGAVDGEQFVVDNEASPFRIRSPYNYSFYRPSNPVGVMSPERFRAAQPRRPPASMLGHDGDGMSSDGSSVVLKRFSCDARPFSEAPSRSTRAVFGFSRADVTDMRLGARSWQNISECVRCALLNLYDNAVRLEDIQNSFSETQARESERRSSLENRTQSEHSFRGGNCAISCLLTLSFALVSTKSELEMQFLALAGDSSALTDVLRDQGQTLAGLNDAWIYQKKKDIANNRLGLSHGGVVDEEDDISLLISRFEDENQELLSELGEAREAAVAKARASASSAETDGSPRRQRRNSVSKSRVSTAAAAAAAAEASTVAGFVDFERVLRVEMKQRAELASHLGGIVQRSRAEQGAQQVEISDLRGAAQDLKSQLEEIKTMLEERREEKAGRDDAISSLRNDLSTLRDQLDNEAKVHDARHEKTILLQAAVEAERKARVAFEAHATPKLNGLDSLDFNDALIGKLHDALHETLYDTLQHKLHDKLNNSLHDKLSAEIHKKFGDRITDLEKKRDTHERLHAKHEKVHDESLVKFNKMQQRQDELQAWHEQHARDQATLHSVSREKLQKQRALLEKLLSSADNGRSSRAEAAPALPDEVLEKAKEVLRAEYGGKFALAMGKIAELTLQVQSLQAMVVEMKSESNVKGRTVQHEEGYSGPSSSALFVQSSEEQKLDTRSSLPRTSFTVVETSANTLGVVSERSEETVPPSPSRSSLAYQGKSPRRESLEERARRMVSLQQATDKDEREEAMSKLREKVQRRIRPENNLRDRLRRTRSVPGKLLKSGSGRKQAMDEDDEEDDDDRASPKLARRVSRRRSFAPGSTVNEASRLTSFAKARKDRLQSNADEVRERMRKRLSSKG